jgi:hypothetical protein
MFGPKRELVVMIKKRRRSYCQALFGATSVNLERCEGVLLLPPTARGRMNSRFNKICVLKEKSRFHYLRSAPFVSNPVGIAGTDLLRVELLYEYSTVRPRFQLLPS